MGDDLLERDVQAAAAEIEEARQCLGNLYPCEALVARLRVLREDREREREAGDVRERLARADRERRQHRVDLAMEATFELLELLRPEILDTADCDPFFGKRRAKLALPEP